MIQENHCNTRHYYLTQKSNCGESLYKPFSWYIFLIDIVNVDSMLHNYALINNTGHWILQLPVNVVIMQLHRQSKWVVNDFYQFLWLLMLLIAYYLNRNSNKGFIALVYLYMSLVTLKWNLAFPHQKKENIASIKIKNTSNTIVLHI